MPSHVHRISTQDHVYRIACSYILSHGHDHTYTQSCKYTHIHIHTCKHMLTICSCISTHRGSHMHTQLALCLYNHTYTHICAHPFTHMHSTGIEPVVPSPGHEIKCSEVAPVTNKVSVHRACTESLALQHFLQTNCVLDSSWVPPHPPTDFLQN